MIFYIYIVCIFATWTCRGSFRADFLAPISGILGHPLEAYIFMGPIYYQKLKHMVGIVYLYCSILVGLK